MMSQNISKSEVWWKSWLMIEGQWLSKTRRQAEIRKKNLFAIVIYKFLQFGLIKLKTHILKNWQAGRIFQK